ncbi:2'-O-glycosyltransferase CruG [Myxacorys almedinensis]|uniref:Glycosyltransferase n=1 Tax=Myxacorys almedinensis A TaxID=2690445 RepID=A0A8J8CME2_9CYAN|nr:glycosyltransferase family 2 protein [Myxacorys almedinensis]NDJ18620.1 glycosyltransferase [Myxacorys almedinensis A]
MLVFFRLGLDCLGFADAQAFAFSGQDAVLVGLLLIQIPAIAILLSRLLKGPTRQLPLNSTSARPELLGLVSVVVPTLNEAKRIAPCLEGLTRQTYEVREITVVDSCSTDGTPDLVIEAQRRDPRFRLITDEPLPSGWVGRPWALHSGFLASSPHSEWILGIDADTIPHPGLVCSLLETAIAEDYDLITLSPRFILNYPGEIWLQPALLMTLVYRFGPAGDQDNPPERKMANGQCCLCKRSLLVELEGYTSARHSFCDDVTLVRHAAARGAKVGFLDGANVLKVRMYDGMTETWNEWGRSLDLKDAAPVAQVWGDLWLLTAVQGLPIVLLGICGFLVTQGNTTLPALLALGINGFLVAIRIALNWAIAPSYDLSQASFRWLFWLSPLADPLAVLRIFLSSTQAPTTWRGRVY